MKIRELLDKLDAIAESSGVGSGFKVGTPYPRTPVKHKDEVTEEVDEEDGEDDE